MKRFTTLALLAPGAALAHGPHAHVDGVAHQGLHGLITALAVIAVALVLAWMRDRRS